MNMTNSIIVKMASGKTKKQGNTPRTQVFLLFDDNTYIELYATATGEIQWYRGCDQGGLEEVENYVAKGYSPIALLKCARLR
jgi:hypothetical protein